MDTIDVQGKYFLTRKHLYDQKESGRRVRKRRRKYYGGVELDYAEALAVQLATEDREDYLLVQVIKEISKPEKSEKEG